MFQCNQASLSSPKLKLAINSVQQRGSGQTNRDTIRLLLLKFIARSEEWKFWINYNKMKQCDFMKIKMTIYIDMLTSKILIKFYFEYNKIHKVS